MGNNKLEAKIQKWADEYAAKGETALRDNLKGILHQLLYLEKALYCYYEPSLPPNPGYWQRLTSWIDNLNCKEDQQLLFGIAARLFFIGPKEIETMHRTAYSVPIKRWLIGLKSIPLNDIDISGKLKSLIQETWFCPITDSMKINEFIHVNNIPNTINYRPDWQSLSKFGNQNVIDKFISDNNIKRIVLLEDFIATGSQAKEAIKFAAQLRPANPLPLLIVPLVLCPKAVETFEAMNLPAHVTIDPVLQLDTHHFISTDAAINSTDFNEIRALAERIHPQVSNGVNPHPSVKPYAPLGFLETGGLVVMYTNTPDNTIPLVHWKSTKWTPIFPRHSRV